MSRLFFTLLILASVNSQADMYCPKPKEIAPEILKSLFDGLKIEEKYTSCLSQSQYRYFRVDEIRYPASEPKCLMEEGGSYKILKVKEIDVSRYRVDFEVHTPKPCEGKKYYKDSFEFITNGKTARKNERSCANLINPPRVNIVRAPCAQLKNK